MFVRSLAISLPEWVVEIVNYWLILLVKPALHSTIKYHRSKCRRKRGSSLSVFRWLQVQQRVCRLLMSLLPPRARGMI